MVAVTKFIRTNVVITMETVAFFSLAELKVRIFSKSVLIDQGMIVDMKVMHVSLLMRWMLQRWQAATRSRRLRHRIVHRAAHDVLVSDGTVEKAVSQFFGPATGEGEQEADPVQDFDPQPVLLSLAEREARVGKVRSHVPQVPRILHKVTHAHEQEHQQESDA